MSDSYMQSSSELTQNVGFYLSRATLMFFYLNNRKKFELIHNLIFFKQIIQLFTTKIS